MGVLYVELHYGRSVNNSRQNNLDNVGRTPGRVRGELDEELLRQYILCKQDELVINLKSVGKHSIALVEWQLPCLSTTPCLVHQ